MYLICSLHNCVHCCSYWFLPEFQRLTDGWSPDDVIFTGSEYNVGDLRNPATGELLSMRSLWINLHGLHEPCIEVSPIKMASSNDR